MVPILLAALLAAPTDAVPYAPTLRPGESVRLTFHRGKDPFGKPGRSRRTFRFFGETTAGLRLELDADPTRIVTVPPDAIDRLERKVGKRSRGQGAIRGLSVGFAIGAALAAASGGCDPDAWCIITPEQAALMSGTLFGVIGAAIGAASADERWQTVRRSSTRPHLSFRLGPVPGGGAGAALGFSF
jgi:hypothetical protein